MKRITLSAMAVVLLAFGWGARAVATTSSQSDARTPTPESGAKPASSMPPRLVYTTTGDGPRRIIILGEGFGAEEDVTALRLVEYRGGDRAITYRVVQP